MPLPRPLRTAQEATDATDHSRVRTAQVPQAQEATQLSFDADGLGSPCAGRDEQMDHRSCHVPHQAIEWTEKFKHRCAKSHTVHSEREKRNHWCSSRTLMEKEGNEETSNRGKGYTWKMFSAPYISPQAIPTVSKDVNKGSIMWRRKGDIQTTNKSLALTIPPSLTACFYQPAFSITPCGYFFYTFIFTKLSSPWRHRSCSIHVVFTIHPPLPTPGTTWHIRHNNCEIILPSADDCQLFISVFPQKKHCLQATSLMECNASKENTNLKVCFMRKYFYCQIDLKNGAYTILLSESACTFVI